MLKCGTKIQLTVKEWKFLELCAQTACNPQTEEDLMAWIDFAKERLNLSEPEERLMAAMLDMLGRYEYLRAWGLP